MLLLPARTNPTSPTARPTLANPPLFATIPLVFTNIGDWPSGKATGSGPVIGGSNPSSPARVVMTPLWCCSNPVCVFRGFERECQWRSAALAPRPKERGHVGKSMFLLPMRSNPLPPSYRDIFVKPLTFPPIETLPDNSPSVNLHFPDNFPYINI